MTAIPIPAAFPDPTAPSSLPPPQSPPQPSPLQPSQAQPPASDVGTLTSDEAPTQPPNVATANGAATTEEPAQSPDHVATPPETSPAAPPQAATPATAKSATLAAKGRPPMDQISRRILAALATPAVLDAQAVARAAGASEAVVRQRLLAMQQSGILLGLEPRVAAAAAGPGYEYLVSGMPTADTDRGAIDVLCAAPGVTRVFGLASRHSVAFTVRGSSATPTQEHGLGLARAAGLAQAQAVLIVSTFLDGAGAALLAEASAGPSRGQAF